MAKILKAYGLNITILSSIYFQQTPVSKKLGRYRGIKFYMPSVCHESKSKIKYIFCKLVYIFKVIGFLIHLKRKWKVVHYIFSDSSIPFLLLLFLERIGVIHLIFNLEEWPLAHDVPYRIKLRSHCFVALALNTCNKFICVSTYLVKQVTDRNRKATVFRLPALTQFNEIKPEAPENIDGQWETTKFLFCGSVGYSLVIFAIIQAYESVYRLRDNKKIELLLILHGNAQQIQEIANYVKRLEHPIEIKTSLSESDLFAEYEQASVLLAPLRFTVQDEARFPQKLAEYTALSKPIITSYVGDVRIYFALDNSAILLDNFSVDELAKKMNFAIENKQKLKSIGAAGNVVGRKYFDYRQYIKKLGDFVLDV